MFPMGSRGSGNVENMFPRCSRGPFRPPETSWEHIWDIFRPPRPDREDLFDILFLAIFGCPVEGNFYNSRNANRVRTCWKKLCWYGTRNLAIRIVGRVVIVQQLLHRLRTIVRHVLRQHSVIAFMANRAPTATEGSETWDLALTFQTLGRVVTLLARGLLVCHVGEDWRPECHKVCIRA